MKHLILIFSLAILTSFITKEKSTKKENKGRSPAVIAFNLNQ